MSHSGVRGPFKIPMPGPHSQRLILKVRTSVFSESSLSDSNVQLGWEPLVGLIWGNMDLRGQLQCLLSHMDLKLGYSGLKIWIYFSHRYYNYIFGFYKWHHGSAKFHTETELQQLLVSVVLDSECDTFPNISSDESCKYLCNVNVSHSKPLVTDWSAKSSLMPWPMVSSWQVSL